ncbi:MULTISPECIES: hypothetical protein [unclassified Rathayibacter]|uniref:hypothetical protein n=1 Tax=unclassified Rathayibacter TaxID=2609250 RepID=UPI0006FCF599|nr:MULTISPECIES: hypothetical protein [unclassified Rathayibacter]KQQ00049.1 hypothetical protein ASF42_16850 [Rathayibacter sp. Leaf294]KQS09503.1 hypothetical protein ASG06_16850 [Rathayibacter sp. Leaf185]
MGPLRAETDVERARWVLDSLGRFGTIDGIVPPVFEAAVRILHPADHREDRPVRWREVAEHAGTVLHSLAQWDDLVGDHPDDYSAPSTGELPLDELAAIAGVLARCTATPEDCLAAFWEGFGVLTGSTTILLSRSGGGAEEPAWMSDTRPTGWEHPEIAAAEYLSLPGRDCLLFSLDVRAMTDTAWARDSGFADASGMTVQTPIALWPEDRAWYLASEIDFDSTVVGGSRELIDALLALAAEGMIEALPLPADADLSSTGDRINRRPR